MDKFMDANKASVIRGKQQQLFLLPAMTFSHITFCIFQMLPFDFPCLPSQNASLWKKKKKKDSLPEPKVVLNILLLTGIGLG